jgi:hypothetical protein
MSLNKLLAICFVGIASNTFAYKPVYPDFGLWNTLNLSYKYNNKVSFMFTQEWRLRENASRLNLFYTNLGIQYTIAKGFKTAFIYRHIDKYLHEGTYFSFRNRLMWDLSYKYNFKQFSISYRHRAQAEWMDFYTSDLGKIPQLFSRNKFEFNYNVNKKWSPYITTEFRIQLTDPRNNADDDNISRNRTIVGVDYTHNKIYSYGAYFLYQQEFNTVTPQILYLLGLECNISLDKLLNKKSNSKDKTKADNASDK